MIHRLAGMFNFIARRLHLGVPHRPVLSLLYGLRMGVAVVFWVSLAHGLSRFAGWTTPARDPATLEAALTPHLHVAAPEGEGPFPTALLFGGCDGPMDNMDTWAAMLREHGWASIVVDSHRPRGLLQGGAWRLVCAGLLLLGTERAGDVAASIAAARRMPIVDAERIVLVGASHGGWTIIEAQLFDAAGETPFGLTRLPDGMARPLDGVVGAILLYPYCGMMNRARWRDWRPAAPVLLVLADRDWIASTANCRSLARSAPVETTLIDGVTHGFDQRERAPFSTLLFDPDATREALRLGAEFLATVAATD